MSDKRNRPQHRVHRQELTVRAGPGRPQPRQGRQTLPPDAVINNLPQFALFMILYFMIL